MDTSLITHLIECPICFEDLESPIYQCAQGHILCSKCIPKFNKCPTCSEIMPKNFIRNRALEDIVESNNLSLSSGSGDTLMTNKSSTTITWKGKSPSQAHKNITCDGPDCKNEIIIGIRYQCLECINYDLCEKCEKKGIHDHHLFIRIAKPIHGIRASKVHKKWNN